MKSLLASHIFVAWLLSYPANAIGARELTWLWTTGISAQYYTETAIIVVLLSALVFVPKFPDMPIPACASRAAWLMILDSGATLALNWFTEYHAFDHSKAMAFFAAGRGIFMGLLWLSLKPSWEFVSVPLPTRAEKAELRQIAQDLRDSGIK